MLKLGLDLYDEGLDRFPADLQTGPVALEHGAQALDDITHLALGKEDPAAGTGLESVMPILGYSHFMSTSPPFHNACRLERIRVLLDFGNFAVPGQVDPAVLVVVLLALFGLG